MMRDLVHGVHAPARFPRGTRAQIRRTMLAFIQRIRSLYRERAIAHRSAFPGTPSPCHTCALNPSTDTWQGFDATATNLMDSLLGERPFFCHEPLPYVHYRLRGKCGGEWVPPEAAIRAAHGLEIGVMRPCAAWWVIKDSPEARRAFIRAVNPERALTDAECDRKADAGAALRRIQQGAP